VAASAHSARNRSEPMQSSCFVAVGAQARISRCEVCYPGVTGM
jgi:hypothetical protein